MAIPVATRTRKKNKRHEEVESHGRHVALRAAFAERERQLARLEQKRPRGAQDAAIETRDV